MRILFGDEQVSRRLRLWNCQQEDARLKQQYQKNYATGEMLSFLVPLGVSSLRAAKVARGAGRARATKAGLTAGLVYTATGAAVSRYNRRSPLDSPGEIAGDVVKDVTLKMGVRVLMARDLSHRALMRASTH